MWSLCSPKMSLLSYQIYSVHHLLLLMNHSRTDFFNCIPWVTGRDLKHWLTFHWLWTRSLAFLWTRCWHFTLQTPSQILCLEVISYDDYLQRLEVTWFMRVFLILELLLLKLMHSGRGACFPVAHVSGNGRPGGSSKSKNQSSWQRSSTSSLPAPAPQSSSGSDNVYCRYHRKFGNNAHRCFQPCTWSENH